MAQVWGRGKAFILRAGVHRPLHGRAAPRISFLCFRRPVSASRYQSVPRSRAVKDVLCVVWSGP
eukprot:10790576-Lingulodinium_polyedra.AAC.1